MQTNPTNCKVCGSASSSVFHQLTFGVWDTGTDTPLQRDSQDYDLVKCNSCGHVQVAAQYHQALFEKLYFHSEQEQVMWHEALVGSDQAYQSMATFALNARLAAPSNSPRETKQQTNMATTFKVIDYGCGTGSLLHAIQQVFTGQQKATAELSLCGVDFNPRCSLDFVEYASADLNQADQMSGVFADSTFDLVCASHTLEHVLDPIAFLRQLAAKLAVGGHIFIEVPDFSQPLHRQAIGQSNLANLQHIHYFTLDTLRLVAKQAGLQILQHQQILTGYIPRLMACLGLADSVLSTKPSTKPSEKQNTKPNNTSAALAVSAILDGAQDKRRALIMQMQQALDEGQNIGLWGIGADFYLMMQEPDFSALCQHPRAHLLDHALQGRSIFGKVILPSSEQQVSPLTVFMLPMLAETRIKMHKIAKLWPAHITLCDPYAVDMLDCEGLQQQACQVCQTTQWQFIGRLNSGIWLSHEEHLTRDELQFDIGLCQQCGHTQIYTPYTQDTFQKLYFSNDQQPQMWMNEAGQLSPYTEMVHALAPWLDGAKTAADFGCGEGLLMQALKAEAPELEVLGFDFNIQGNDQGIQRVKCDLNNADDLLHAGGGQGFDLVLSSHVLEHVINPVAFLTALRERLSSNGVLFIEVPDASPQNADLNLQTTNLVHPQHIHYFTEASLVAIGQRAGLRVLSQKQFISGDIPRLQMVFCSQLALDEVNPSDDGRSQQHVLQTAQACVQARFSQYNAKLSLLMQKLQQGLQSHQKIGLWGIGGDFYQLYCQSETVRSALISGKIHLFDYSLKGKYFEGRLIHCSSEAALSDYPIFMLPMYAPTRATMHRVSKDWQNQAIDVYDTAF